MKTIKPNYYDNFKCIAQHCKHNCCIGWEIDIDPDTLVFYQELPSPWGDKLRSHISLDNTPHFILGRNDRCPFLNEDNLCELICAFGEDGLCNICADHPRFFNEFSDRIECGLGLCCEEAARLILSQNEPVQFSADEDSAENATAEERTFFKLRQDIYSILQNRSVSMRRRIDQLFDAYSVKQLPPLSDFKKIYQRLERMDPQWDHYIDQFEDTDWFHRWEIPCEQLAVYLVYRHLAGALNDGRLKERIRFIALTLRIFNCLIRNRTTLEDLYEIARLYSAEIEYSDENIEILLDHLK
ncbi:MAG: flagellin lysine-N-methylase [Clostridia bacterium]|nr:flagellin lysine-N-methylase [Clostridia bacterium]